MFPKSKNSTQEVKIIELEKGFSFQRILIVFTFASLFYSAVFNFQSISTILLRYNYIFGMVRSKVIDDDDLNGMMAVFRGIKYSRAVKDGLFYDW